MPFAKRSILFWVTAALVLLIALISGAEVGFIVSNEWHRLVDTDGLDAALSSVLLFYCFIYFVAAYFRMESLMLAFALACLVKGILNITVVTIGHDVLKLYRVIFSGIAAVIRIITSALAACVACEVYRQKFFVENPPLERTDTD